MKIFMLFFCNWLFSSDEIYWKYPEISVIVRSHCNYIIGKVDPNFMAQQNCWGGVS